MDEWSVGDEVFGSVGKPYLGGGTLAEFATMAVGTIARKPSSVEHPAAAAIPVAGVTALMMADALQLSEGQVVVANGATGGVGSYLVQIASRRGARVVAVCSGENADHARTLGAADVIDYTTGDVAGQVRSRYPDGVDAFADMHGEGDTAAQLAEQVRSGGRVASAVGSADMESLAGRGIESTNVQGRVITERLEVLAGMLDRGEIDNPEFHTFSLAEADRAFEQGGSGHTRGKVVVTPA